MEEQKKAYSHSVKKCVARAKELVEQLICEGHTVAEIRFVLKQAGIRFEDRVSAATLQPRQDQST